MPQRRTRGSGELYREPSGSWAFRLTIDGRRRYRGGFPSRDIANRARAKALGEAVLGRAGLTPDDRSSPKLRAIAVDFLRRRASTHRAADCDAYRWHRHMVKHFGHLRPSQVDVGVVRGFVEAKLDDLAPGTIRICISLLSMLFESLRETNPSLTNPCRGLPESLRRLMRSNHDPKTTPFIESLDDVVKVFRALPHPVNVAFALGAFGGLRTGEVLALRWPQVKLSTRRIHVCESVRGPLKDRESRLVPVVDSLYEVLAAWSVRAENKRGRVLPPLRRDGKKVDRGTLWNALDAALDDLGLPRITWYQATRHTFASHWVMAGGSIEKLKEILGHYSVVMTERYAHLTPELFSAKDLHTISVPVLVDGKPSGSPAALQGANEATVITAESAGAAL